MASGFMNRFKNLMSFHNEVEDEDEIYDELMAENIDYGTTVPAQMDNDISRKAKSNLKVLSHPSSSAYEVMVVEPKCFDESLDLVNSLRERKTLVLNLHLLDSEQSQRVVDFLSGATHAIDGHQQRIGDGVFIFTPSNVTVSAESRNNKIINDTFWNHPQ